ncbi:MAG: iviTM7 [Candidatus Saccharibacteria bacterium]|nr:iviTM7 [Candidatus Saccharibacteria bacterium]
MSDRLKFILIVTTAIIIGAGSVAYGAATAPKPIPKPVATVQPISKTELAAELKAEQPTITSVLTASYPLVETNYLINQGQLFDQGQWYGTTLSYKGTDSLNRDTLRVLMQKKQGIWILRTLPPRPLLSTVEFPDVPESILDEINKAISLPGDDATPAASANV